MPEFNETAVRALKDAWRMAASGNKQPLMNVLAGVKNKDLARLLEWYTMGGSGSVAQSLNAPGYNTGNMPKIKALDSIVKQMPPENQYSGPMYRGITVPTGGSYPQDILNAMPGDALVSDVPVSFTKRYDTSRYTFAHPNSKNRVVIAVPKSTQGQNIGPLSSFGMSRESEVLVPSNTGFEVTNIRNISDSGKPLRIVEAREVPNFNRQAAQQMGQKIWSRGLKSILPMQLLSMLMQSQDPEFKKKSIIEQMYNLGGYNTEAPIA